MPANPERDITTYNYNRQTDHNGFSHAGYFMLLRKKEWWGTDGQRRTGFKSGKNLRYGQVDMSEYKKLLREL